jgi:CAAX prenyl protease-like protein
MFLRKALLISPVVARVTPFVVFVLLTSAQGRFGDASLFWFYLLKTLVGLWMIWEMRPVVAEMRWAFSWKAVVTGVAVFAMWVALGHGWFTQSVLWVKLGIVKAPATAAMPWNPNLQFGAGSPLAWLFIVTRILGSTFIVPPLEEVFYRSFLYRYVASQNFLAVPLNRFLPLPFVASALIFGFSHNEWLAGILCGAAYQGLVIRKNRLGDAMTAHAITNCLLGIWVVWRGAWNFW